MLPQDAAILYRTLRGITLFLSAFRDVVPWHWVNSIACLADSLRASAAAIDPDHYDSITVVAPPERFPVTVQEISDGAWEFVV